MIMLNVTDDVDILTRGAEPTWSDETAAQLDAHPVEVVSEDVTGVENDPDSGWLEALEFEDGTRREYRGGFAMYGSDYNTALAEGLGCDLTEGGGSTSTTTRPYQRERRVRGRRHHPGHNQVPVAMGQGAKAGLAIHKDIREFPRSQETIGRTAPSTPTRCPPSRQRSWRPRSPTRATRGWSAGERRRGQRGDARG